MLQNVCAYSALGRFGVCMSFCQVTLQTSLLCVTFWLKGPKCLDDIQSEALQSKSESLSLKRIFKPGLFSPNPPTPFVAPVTPGRGRTFMSEDVVSSGC